MVHITDGSQGIWNLKLKFNKIEPNNTLLNL